MFRLNAPRENCKECKMQTEMMTYLEHLQDKQIKEEIEYLPDEKRFLASYPYTDEIHNLLPNKEIVLRRAISLEHNLKKKPEDIDLLNKSLFDSFDRGVFVSYLKKKSEPGLAKFIIFL